MVDLNEEVAKMVLEIKNAVGGLADSLVLHLIDEKKCKECGYQNEIAIDICEKCGSLTKTKELIDKWGQIMHTMINQFDNFQDPIRKLYRSTFSEALKNLPKRHETFKDMSLDFDEVSRNPQKKKKKIIEPTLDEKIREAEYQLKFLKRQTELEDGTIIIKLNKENLEKARKKKKIKK